MVVRPPPLPQQQQQQQQEQPGPIRVTEAVIVIYDVDFFSLKSDRHKSGLSSPLGDKPTTVSNVGPTARSQELAQIAANQTDVSKVSSCLLIVSLREDLW